MAEGAAINALLGKKLSSLYGTTAQAFTNGSEDDISHARIHAGLALNELFQEYGSRLSEPDYYGRLVEVGEFLVNIQAYELASEQYFGVCIDSIDRKYGNQPGALGDDLLSLKITSSFGKARSQILMIREEDPYLRRHESLTKSVVFLQEIQTSMRAVVQNDGLYWLTYNGTVILYELVKSIVVAGFVSEVVEFLGWSILCMESVVQLCTVKFLPWRIRLYSALISSYEDMGMLEKAREVLTRATQKVNNLEALERSDPLPLAEETENTLNDAKRMLAVYTFKYKALGGEGGAGAAAPAGGKGGKGAAPAASGGSDSALLAELSEIFSLDRDRLRALCYALKDGKRRSAKREAPTGEKEGHIPR